MCVLGAAVLALIGARALPTPVAVELLGFHERMHPWECLGPVLMVLMWKPARNPL